MPRPGKDSPERNMSRRTAPVRQTQKPSEQAVPSAASIDRQGPVDHSGEVSAVISDDQFSQLAALEERLASAQSAALSRLQGSDSKLPDKNDMQDMQENLFSARWSAMTDQINAFINEIAEIRNDIGEIRNEVRVARTQQRRGMQAFEDQLAKQREDLVSAIQAETEKFDQRIGELKSSTEQVALVGAVPAELETRLQTLQQGLDQEAARRASGDEDLARVAQEVSGRLQELSEVLRQRDFDATTTEVPQLGRDARPGSTGSGASLSPPGKAVEPDGNSAAGAESADVAWIREELATEKKKRRRDQESTAQQLKELRLCLEAEVGARSAANERLDRQVHDMRNEINTEISEAAVKSMKSIESAVGKDIQLVQGSLQQQTNLIREEVAARKAGDEKLRQSLELEGQSRDNSDLQLGVLRESLTLLENKMKSRATRQDTVEASVAQMAKQLSSEVQSRIAGDEDIKQWTLSELKEQAMFFKSELKNLLTSAHNSYSHEVQKIWNKLQAANSSKRSDVPDTSPSNSGTGTPSRTQSKTPSMPPTNQPPTPGSDDKARWASGGGHFASGNFGSSTFGSLNFNVPTAGSGDRSYPQEKQHGVLIGGASGQMPSGSRVEDSEPVSQRPSFCPNPTKGSSANVPPGVSEPPGSQRPSWCPKPTDDSSGSQRPKAAPKPVTPPVPLDSSRVQTSHGMATGPLGSLSLGSGSQSLGSQPMGSQPLGSQRLASPALASQPLPSDRLASGQLEEERQFEAFMKQQRSSISLSAGAGSVPFGGHTTQSEAQLLSPHSSSRISPANSRRSPRAHSPLKGGSGFCQQMVQPAMNITPMGGDGRGANRTPTGQSQPPSTSQRPTRVSGAGAGSTLPFAYKAPS